MFLDEVGELPLDTQVKLLRVLQQKEVEPVGAGKPVPINVRIISATNRDLQQEINDRQFREDLFFRLNVLQIHLPPLRDRRDDIPALASHFIERFCAHEGGVPKDISSMTAQHLQDFDWPGNVRQLENTINRAMVIGDGSMLDISNLGEITAGANATTPSPDPTPQSQSISVISSDGSVKGLDSIEQEAMQITLAHFDHNITQSAKALGMAKSTFYKKLKSQL